MAGLADMRVSREDVLRIVEIVGPYLQTVSEFMPNQGGAGEREHGIVHVHAEAGSVGSRIDGKPTP
jgi:hypothetical protein